MLSRLRIIQSKSLKQRVTEEAATCREQAKLLPPGFLREALLRKARQAETAAHMDDWLRSQGLQPPK